MVVFWNRNQRADHKFIATPNATNTTPNAFKGGATSRGCGKVVLNTSIAKATSSAINGGLIFIDRIEELRRH